MYKVSIYNKSKKIVATYTDIDTVKYIDILGDSISISGDKLLTHEFPTNVDYHLFSKNGNFSIDRSVIGTFEVVKLS